MAFPLVPQPKKRPKLLDKRDKQAAIKKLDDEQKAICKKRSGGLCEVRTQKQFEFWDGCCFRPEMLWARCGKLATENHHLIGGSGRRNKGRSILAAHRLHVCDRCHKEITGKVLVPCVPQADAERADKVRYERVR